MTTDISDLSDTILANSDQLNAADIAEPITVTITGGRKVADPKQPVILEISGGYQPWKPCKTMRRLLGQAWGLDGRAYIGRTVTLYSEPNCRYGGKQTAGIRVKALSHIERPFDYPCSEWRGDRRVYQIGVVKAGQAPKPAAPFDYPAALESLGITAESVEAWHVDTFGRPSPEDKREMVDHIAATPSLLERLKS